MNNLREIIPNNIIKLRKAQGLTQLDLGKRVNYSDKAVSRWEKGEVLPDVETLQSISEVFNVPVSYLFEEHDESKVQTNIVNRQKNDIIFQIFSCLVVWTIATLIFVFGELNFDKIFWQIFVWSVPATCIVVSTLNRKKKNRLLNLVVNSIFIWSFLTAFYLQFLDFNAWIFFLIGVPIQAAFVVFYLGKTKYKN